MEQGLGDNGMPIFSASLGTVQRRISLSPGAFCPGHRSFVSLRMTGWLRATPSYTWFVQCLIGAIEALKPKVISHWLSMHNCHGTGGKRHTERCYSFGYQSKTAGCP